MDSFQAFDLAASAFQKRQQGILAIPTTYLGLNSGPQPGILTAIVVGAVGGFLLIIGIIYSLVAFGGGAFRRRRTVVTEEVVDHRGSSNRPRRSRVNEEDVFVERRTSRRPGSARVRETSRGDVEGDVSVWACRCRSQMLTLRVTYPFHQGQPLQLTVWVVLSLYMPFTAQATKHRSARCCSSKVARSVHKIDYDAAHSRLSAFGLFCSQAQSIASPIRTGTPVARARLLCSDLSRLRDSVYYIYICQPRLLVVCLFTLLVRPYAGCRPGRFVEQSVRLPKPPAPRALGG